MTKCDETQRPAPDLVNRAFGAEGPNQLWVAHMTNVPTWSVFIYLAIVLDVLGSVARWLGPHMSLEDQSPGQRPENRRVKPLCPRLARLGLQGPRP